jgi:hypothetical protein
MKKTLLAMHLLFNASLAFGNQWANITNRTIYEPVYFHLRCGNGYWSNQKMLYPRETFRASCFGDQIIYVSYKTNWLCGYRENAVKWARGNVHFKMTECGMDLAFDPY